MADEIILPESVAREPSPRKKRIYSEKSKNNWVRGNEKKRQILGMPFGTAMGRLRKAIMFELACKLERDVCFRCSMKIKTVDEFSIEHKDSWQLSEDPIAAFFDLQNIAFSHYACNISAATRTKVYANKAECDRIHNVRHQANRVVQRKRWRERRRSAGLPYT